MNPIEAVTLATVVAGVADMAVATEGITEGMAEDPMVATVEAGAGATVATKET
jgi:hypothetical protein